MNENEKKKKRKMKDKKKERLRQNDELSAHTLNNTVKLMYMVKVRVYMPWDACALFYAVLILFALPRIPMKVSHRQLSFDSDKFGLIF